MRPSTSRSPSMGSEDNFPTLKYFVILVILLGVCFALPFHSAVRKWFREMLGRCFSRISSCLRICVFGSGEEANERDADAALQEQVELRDLVVEIQPVQNRDYLRVGGRPQLPYELRDFRNNLIEFRPDGGNLRDPQLPQTPIGMIDLQQNPINLRPDGEMRREHRPYGLSEIMVEMRNLRNNLDNLPNRNVRRNQEHSL